VNRYGVFLIYLVGGLLAKFNGVLTAHRLESAYTSFSLMKLSGVRASFMVAKSNIQRILVILMVFMVSSSLHTYAQDDTPPPPSEITFTLKDNVDSLRVRSGAGTDFAVLGILDASTVDTFVIDPQKYDPNSDWIEGTFGETQTGFIYADYTDVTLNTPTGTSLNPLQRAASWNNPTPSPTPAAEQQVIGRSNAQASGNNSSAENSNASTQGVEVAMAPEAAMASGLAMNMEAADIPLEFFTDRFDFRTVPYYDFSFPVDNSPSNRLTGADGSGIIDGFQIVGVLYGKQVPPQFAWGEEQVFDTNITYNGDYPIYTAVAGPTAFFEAAGLGKIVFGIDIPGQRIELAANTSEFIRIVFIRRNGQLVGDAVTLQIGSNPSTDVVFGDGYFTAPLPNGEVIRIEEGTRLLATSKTNASAIQPNLAYIDYTGGSTGGMLIFQLTTLLIPVD
jgi:hypothetical protein